MLKFIKSPFALLLLFGLFMNSCDFIEEKIVPTDPNQSEIFVKMLGGIHAQEVHDVLETEDGYIMVGSSKSFTDFDSDIYIVKVDKEGNEIANRRIEGTYEDAARRIQKVEGEDAYIIMADIGQPQSETSFIKILKINGNLDFVIWETIVNEPTDSDNFLYQFSGNFHYDASADCDCYWVMGSGTSNDTLPLLYDIAIGKISSEGDSRFLVNQKLWSYIGDNNTDTNVGGEVVQADNDYGVDIIANPFDNNNPYIGLINFDVDTDIGSQAKLILIDGNGEQNSVFVGGEGQIGADLEATNDDGYIMIGTDFNEIPSRIYVTKTNMNTQILWTKYPLIAPDLPNTHIEASSIKALDNGHFLISGTIMNPDNERREFFMALLDENGNNYKEERFGNYLDLENDKGDHRATKAIATSDGGFLLVGTSWFQRNTMMTLIKTNANLEIVPSN